MKDYVKMNEKKKISKHNSFKNKKFLFVVIFCFEDN